MRSSISSSDPAPDARARLPGGRLGRSLCCGVIAGALLLAGWELAWRAAGYRPTLTDDADLWAGARARLASADGHSIALLGSSRMLVDFVPEVLESRCPGYVVAELGIDGQFPLPVLRDLAFDPSFHGLVLCEITAEGFIDNHGAQPTRWVEAARHWRLEKRLARSLRSMLQERFVSVHPMLAPQTVLLRWAESGRRPSPYYITVRRDRWSRADCRLVDASRLARGWRNAFHERAMPAPAGAAWDTLVEVADSLVMRIQARGGEVVFICFPSSGGLHAMEDAAYPRERYWDRMSRMTHAATLHFEDVAALAAYTCPDEAHLDYRDAGAFTRDLVATLDAWRLLPGDAALPAVAAYPPVR